MKPYSGSLHLSLVSCAAYAIAADSCFLITAAPCNFQQVLNMLVGQSMQGQQECQLYLKIATKIPPQTEYNVQRTRAGGQWQIQLCSQVDLERSLSKLARSCAFRSVASRSSSGAGAQCGFRGACAASLLCMAPAAGR